MKINIIIIAALLALAAPAAAAPAAADSAFESANSAYASGDYDKAVAGYTAAIDGGVAGPNVYYNLGNAYLKRGDVGRAVLNYERAKLFAPRDAALRANLRVARSLMKQKDPPSGKNWFEIGLNNLFRFFTLKEIFFLDFLLYYMLTSLSLIWLFVRDKRRYAKNAIVVLVVLMTPAVLSLGNRIYELEKSAIIIGAVTDAKYEPLDRSRTHFPLYDGMKVSVLKSEEGWRKIRRADGKIGWINRDMVELIAKKQ